MHGRRILKIILILLAVFFLVLGIIWLIGRHTAEKNGSMPLSFRQFLGLGTKTSSVSTVPNEGGGTFTGEGNGANGNGNGTGTTGANPSLSSLANPNISQFTNNGTSIGAGTGSNGNSSGISGTGANGNSSGSSNNSNSASTTSAAAAATTPACGDADTNIDFTPQEVAELNELQNRFYAIAQNLHSDSDVETQLANHDAFAAKADQVTELYNYCESKLPVIAQNIAAGTTDPRLALHIETPFWSEPDNNRSFLYFTGTYEAHLQNVHDNSTDFKDTVQGPYGILDYASPSAVPITGSSLTDTGVLMPVIEKVLRINLW